MKKLILSITFFFSVTISAQETSIILKGKIFNQADKKPLVFGTVIILELKIKTRVSGDGSYQISISEPGEYTVLIRGAGVKSLQTKINLTTNTEKNFYLRPALIRTKALIIRDERNIQKISQEVISLEQPVGDDDDKSTLAEFIKDDTSPTPIQTTSQELLRDQIREIIGDLTDREKKILEMRFGLEDGVTHTLEEVGKVFSVKRERIRQIEAKALEKIRMHERAAKLSDY